MIQNITIRVPWTDNGWCGKVCNHPCGKYPSILSSYPKKKLGYILLEEVYNEKQI